MANLEDHLKISRCPHCSVDNPNFVVQKTLETSDYIEKHQRVWKVYVCKRCGGLLTAWAYGINLTIQKIYPDVESANNSLPSRVKAFLQQAMDSTFAPAGSVVLSARAVDAMLKKKGYTKSSLYGRIEEGIKAHLLTPEMGTWAHQVRLDANDQRHADDNAGLPTVEDAKQAIEFAKTLAEFLFVLPSKVSRGIASSKHESEPAKPERSSPGAMPKGSPLGN